MALWLVWLSILAIGGIWFGLVAMLCRQIAAGKWEPGYWPAEPTSRAELIDLDAFKKSLDHPDVTATISPVRFTPEGSFSQR